MAQSYWLCEILHCLRIYCYKCKECQNMWTIRETRSSSHGQHLISDLIHLPECDFVLKLTEGMSNPRATLKNNVVTADLVRDFEEAVGFIRGGQ